MPEPVTLAGTGWTLPGAANPTAAPRLEFSAAGRVTGYTGCNMLTGSYTYDGDRLEVVAATTKRACLGAGNEAEALMLAILAAVRARPSPAGLILTTPTASAWSSTRTRSPSFPRRHSRERIQLSQEEGPILRGRHRSTPARARVALAIRSGGRGPFLLRRSWCIDGR